MIRPDPPMRPSRFLAEAATARGQAFFAWALSYPQQDELLDCCQAVVLDAFCAGWDAALITHQDEP